MSESEFDLKKHEKPVNADQVDFSCRNTNSKKFDACIGIAD